MSSVIFADTSFYIALLVQADSLHTRAVGKLAEVQGKILTSSWVLVELGNYFSPISRKDAFTRLMLQLRSSTDVMITPPSEEDFEAGLALFNARPDKSWSLVDCISFQLMKRFSIADALTADHHFVQAGFNAMLV